LSEIITQASKQGQTLTISNDSHGQGRIIIPGLDPATPYYSRLSVCAVCALHGSFICFLTDGKPRSRPRNTAPWFHSAQLPGPRFGLGQKEIYGKKSKPDTALILTTHFCCLLARMASCQSESERGLPPISCFALNDHLVTDLGTEWLFPLLWPSHQSEIRVQMYWHSFQRAESSIPEVRSWSPETRHAVSQKYTQASVTSGLARGRFARRRSVRSLYGAPVAFLIRALRLAGVASARSRARACNSGFSPSKPAEIIDALGELNRLGGLRSVCKGISLNWTSGRLPDGKHVLRAYLESFKSRSGPTVWVKAIDNSIPSRLPAPRRNLISVNTCLTSLFRSSRLRNTSSASWI